MGARPTDDQGQAMKLTGSYLAIVIRQALIARPSRLLSNAAVSPPAIQFALSRGSCSLISSSGSSTSSRLASLAAG